MPFKLIQAGYPQNLNLTFLLAKVVSKTSVTIVHNWTQLNDLTSIRIIVFTSRVSHFKFLSSTPNYTFAVTVNYHCQYYQYWILSNIIKIEYCQILSRLIIVNIINIEYCQTLSSAIVFPETETFQLLEIDNMWQSIVERRIAIHFIIYHYLLFIIYYLLFIILLSHVTINCEERDRHTFYYLQM